MCTGCQTVLGLDMFPHIPASLLSLPNISSVYTWSLYRIKADINDMRSALSLMIVWWCATPLCLWHGNMGTMVTAANSVLELYICVRAPSCRTLCNLMACSLQSPLSLGFPRQKYWSGLPFPPPGDHPDPRMEPKSLVLAGGFFTTEPPGKPYLNSKPVRAYWKMATSTNIKSSV